MFNFHQTLTHLSYSEQFLVLSRELTSRQDSVFVFIEYIQGRGAQLCMSIKRRRLARANHEVYLIRALAMEEVWP